MLCASIFCMFVCLEKEAFAQHTQRNATHLTLHNLRESNKPSEIRLLKTSHLHVSYILALRTGEILDFANEGYMSLE